MPVSAINLQDILDRINVHSGREIEFMFSKYDMVDLPADVLDKWYKADIYKLNVFADRFQRLEDHQKAGFKSVLMRNPDSSIDDMIAMTYGIDCVLVYPAATYAEIGEIAVENDMLPEIEECSDAVIRLLDYEKVGKLLAERDKGVLFDGYYCMPDSYEEPGISLTIEVPDKRFFRVLVSPSAGTVVQLARGYTQAERILSRTQLNSRADVHHRVGVSTAKHNGCSLLRSMYRCFCSLR